MTDLALGVILSFALTSAVIEMTPGPNMAYLAIVAATEGRRPGYAAVMGVALGLATIGLIAALGLAAAIAATPLAYQSLRWAGVAYLLWLAWDAWREPVGAHDLAAPGSSLWRYFQRGLITNLLNPKAAAFFVSVLPMFVPTGGAVLQPTLVLTAIYVLVATLIHLGIVTAAGTARHWLTDPVWERKARRALALALGLVALWFALKTRA